MHPTSFKQSPKFYITLLKFYLHFLKSSAIHTNANSHLFALIIIIIIIIKIAHSVFQI